MMITPKVTVTNHRNEIGKIAFQVYSLGTGMIIGSLQNGLVNFGEDPNHPEVRAFIDNESAEIYLKDKCKAYIGRDDVDFLSREGDPIIQQASQIPNQRRAM